MRSPIQPGLYRRFAVAPGAIRATGGRWAYQAPTVPAKSGLCDLCGHWDSHLVQGACVACNAKFQPTTEAAVMYPDHDIERWGNLFAKHQVYRRIRLRFSVFMGLSDNAKRECLQHFLDREAANPPSTMRAA